MKKPTEKDLRSLFKLIQVKGSCWKLPDEDVRCGGRCVLDKYFNCANDELNHLNAKSRLKTAKKLMKQLEKEYPIMYLETILKMEIQ
jgi:hypothetical protein